MENWLLIVEVNCKDPKREGEFNAWYDTIHIPDILSGSPGFKSAIRYTLRNPVPGRGKFLALYEIETENIDQTLEAHKKNVETKYAAGRKTDLLELVTRRVCKVK